MLPKSIAFGLVLSFSSMMLAADWPQWRGPNRDGVSSETGLLSEWGEDGPKLLFMGKGLGKGMSSVAVANGRIFTMGTGRDGSQLHAMDADTGELIWSTKVGGGNPNCSPTVDGDLVYALGRSGDLLCANAKTGEEVWQKNFSSDFGGKMMSGWGYSESPLIDGERLICTPGSKDAQIVALDKKTGDLVWKSALPDVGNKGRDGAAYSTVVLSEAGGVKQYIQLVGRGIVSFAANDGRFLWSYNRIANGTANIPTPIVKGDYVFCSTGYNTGAALLKISKVGDSFEVNEEYFLKPNVMQNHHGGMLLIGDYIYCGHGHNNGLPLCLNMKTGEASWGPERGAGRGSAAIVAADRHLYFRYQDGTMALIEATPDAYKLKGKFKLASVKGQSWPHPVIANGKLYLRDQDVVMVYDIKSK